MSQDFILRQNQSAMIVEWRIHRFLSLLGEPSYQHSPAFQLSDKQWYLEIWPSGYNGRPSTGYVSLILFPRFHVLETCAMKVKFGFINADEVQIVLHKFEYTFKSSKGFGRHKFVPHSLFKTSKNILSPGGTFTIWVTISGSTPAVLEDGINFPRQIALRGTSPQEVSVEWKVRDFFSLPVVKGLYVRSPPFDLADAKWCLDVYPNGQDTENLEGIALLLRRKGSKSEKHMVVFTLGIRKRDDSFYRLFHFVSEFTSNKAAQGIQTLLKPSELRDSEPELIFQRSIALYCTARVYPSHLATETPMEHEEGASQSTSSKDVAISRSLTAKVQENFRDIFLSRRVCDVNICVKGDNIPSHRVILAARSPVFSAMFENDTEESRTGIVNVDNFDAASFKDFLSFLYSGYVNVVSSSNAISLYKAVLQYKVEDKDLKSECVRCLQDGLNLETFLQVVPFLKIEPNLWDIAESFYVNNEKEIESSPEWEKLRSLNRDVINTLQVKKIAKDIETSDSPPVKRTKSGI